MLCSLFARYAMLSDMRSLIMLCERAFIETRIKAMEKYSRLCIYLLGFDSLPSSRCF
jgi:hypothetical protein